MTLAALRHRAQLTQARLAARLGVGRAVVSRWEMGHTHPRRSRHVALRRILRCSAQELYAALNTHRHTDAPQSRESA
jgi:DNA-binding transcriptional regulator YiaG